MNPSHEDETLSETMNPELPEDIIFNIISRLPVKDLCRYRCVSKEFSNLPNNPHFPICNSATLKSTTPISGFFFQHRNKPRYVSAHTNTNADTHSDDFLMNTNDDYSSDDEDNMKNEPTDLPDPLLSFLKHKDDDIVNVLDSCYGLLLCIAKVSLGKWKRLYVCNPLTEEKVSVPFPCNSKSTALLTRNYEGKWALFADLTPTRRILYKVFHISRSKIFIFSSQTRVWEKIEERVPDLFCEFRNMSKVIFNGTLFWDGFYEHTLVLGGENNDKSFELMKSPYGRSIWDHNGKLLCYSHGWCKEDDGSCVRQLSFDKNNKFEWTIFNSKELSSLEKDVGNEYISFRGYNNLSDYRREVGKVHFSIMAYSPKLNTLWLQIADKIFRFEMSERKLRYHSTRCPSSSYGVIPYIHSFSAIQASLEKVPVEPPTFKYLMNCQRGSRKKKGQQ